MASAHGSHAPQRGRKARRLREAVKKCVAAGQKWCCGRCRCLLTSTYEVNHILPHCVTQDDGADNLVALCKECHGWYTQQQAYWLSRHRQVRAAHPSFILCIGCRRCVSAYFWEAHTRACSRQFTFACFPLRAPSDCVL